MSADPGLVPAPAVAASVPPRAPESPPLPDWLLEASLGIFVHWGPYSVPAWAEPRGALGAVPEEEWFEHNAYAEWYANTIRLEGSPAAERHAELYGGAPYLHFLDAWRAESYDPQEWAALFRAAGADYVVPTAKHHDGVALWPAPGDGAPSTSTRGPRRDLISPLAEAVRAAGMRFAVYYSGGLDWDFAEHPPIRASSELADARPVDAAYNEYAFRQLVDLIDRYRPSLIWNDIDWPDAGKTPGPFSLDALFEHYRRVVPDGVVNDRWGAGRGDYRTSEYEHDTGNETAIGWEHCRGLGFSFGYNQVEDESLTLIPRELARVYADVVSRGGRLLLNIGPTAAGEIPAVQRRTLEGFGRWMSVIKPLTSRRRPLVEGELEVQRREDSDEPVSWWRAWRGEAGIVVVAADPATLTVHAPGGEPVVVLALPEEG